MRLPRRLDAYVAIALFIAAFWLCVAHLRHVGPGHFYQLAFSPAVTFACTGKLEALTIWDGSALDPAAVPELVAVQEFLSSKRPTLRCQDVPAAPVGRTMLSSLQYQTLYLMAAIGLVWWITGISWSAALIVGGLLVGAFVLVLYGICRLFLPIAWAVAATALSTISPLQESMTPHLRDYAKAPFILATIFFAGWLVKSRDQPARCALVAALAGLVAGVGFGFRADLAVSLPFFALVLLGLLVWTRLRAWRHIALAGALFAIAFAAAAFPVLRAYRGGGLFGHVALLGLTTWFNAPLGLNSTSYDIGRFYLDESVSQFIHAYAARVRDTTGLSPPLEYLGPDYGRYSLLAFAEYVGWFPADMLLRGYAAILKTIAVDFGQLPPEPGSYALRGNLLVPPIAPYLLFAALALVGATDAAMAAFLVLALTYFGGLGALQFNYRHSFHLEFFYWLSLGVVTAAVWGFVVNGWPIRSLDWFRSRSAARMAGGAAVPVVCLGAALLLLMVARIYQQTHVGGLFDRYLAVARQSVRLDEQQRGNAVLLRPLGKMPNLSGSMTALGELPFDGFYLAMSVDGDRCPGNRFSAKLAYRSDSPYSDPSRTVHVRLPQDAQLFFPVVSCGGPCPGREFEGLLVPAEQRQCIAAIDAVSEYRSLSLPLWLSLGSNWREAALYQTLTHAVWPFGQAPPPEPPLFTAPPELKVVEELRSLAVKPLTAESWTHVYEPTTVSGTRLRISGVPIVPSWYAASSRSLHLPRGALVVARGKVERGGITFGLQRRDTARLEAALSVPRGDFLAVLQVPAAGEYQLVVANNLAQVGMRNDAEITEIGVALEPPPLASSANP